VIFSGWGSLTVRGGLAFPGICLQQTKISIDKYTVRSALRLRPGQMLTKLRLGSVEEAEKIENAFSAAFHPPDFTPLTAL
jgi:hypothetical protein